MFPQRRPSLRTANRSVSHYPLLFRPLALAYRREGTWLTLLCLALLAVIFVANGVTPVRVVFSAAALVPLLVAMWLLSDGQARVVALAALTMVAVTGLVGIVSPVTAAVQLVVFLAIAVLVRIYASWLAALLIGLQHTRRTTVRAVLGLAWPKESRSPAKGETLTLREREVAELAAQGYTARELAARLGIGERTVESHLAGVYAKLGVHSKLELVRYAARLGLRATPEASTEDAKDR